MKIAARVIHEVDEQGNVLRIGWEPAAAVNERAKAVKQMINLIEKSSAILPILDERVGATIQHAELVQAITDSRSYVLVLMRDAGHGANLPRWEQSPASNRYKGISRRAA